MIRQNRLLRICLCGVLASALAGFGAAVASSASGASAKAEERPNGGVSFEEIAAPGTALANYRRGPSPELAIRLANRQREQITFGDFAQEPIHDRGIAGVAMFDYDGDDDLDIFVTNGPGRPNSLYQNQLGKTAPDKKAPDKKGPGKKKGLEFVDVAAEAGVALTDLDANGACAGDIDNDGHVDLYVLGRNAPNHLLRNRGDGTFTDVTVTSGTGAGTFSHASCTMADFDGNGLLDIAIANSFDMRKALAIFAVPYALNQPNQLLQNEDGRRFTDVSDRSGLTNTVVTDPPPGEQPPFAGISWAIAAVDYDQDGDPDIMVANDQAAYPMKKYGGLDRGLLRVYQNNGTGTFKDVTHEVGTAEPGAWMGLSYGDFNFDGTLDVFTTSAGDYLFLPLPEMGISQGDMSSRWFLQRGDHTFADPRRSTLKEPLKDGADPDLGGLGATPWGWGTSTLDYDNDTDTDIIYHGALDGMFWVTSDNPGALLENKGPKALRKGFYPAFDLDDALTKAGTDHRRRTVTGVAVGDLNQDGFDDIVSVAQSRKVGDLTPYADDASFDFGSPFDKDAAYLKTYERVGGGPSVPSILLRPTGNGTADGDLSVQINKGNTNHSATVRTLGSVGITPGGRVNRDGVGAVVKFTPKGSPAAIRPVIAGSSFASQDALEGTFGMGRHGVGTVEVLWPGGVRNKLFDVNAGERITFPEIPCSYDDTSLPLRSYVTCVKGALEDLVAAGELARPQAQRFLNSAIAARSHRR
jgi:enediyne biosynthesis protein E4